MSATRTIWKMSDFEDANRRTKYQQALSAKLENWRSTCNPLLLHPGTEAQMNSNVLDISYHLLVETIQNGLAETIAVKTVGPDQRSYWDASLQELIEQRTKAYREAKEKYINGDAAFAEYERKYVDLRQKVHAHASRKKAACHQRLLENLDTQFITDRRHFFREIVRLRKQNCTTISPQSMRSADGPNDITSDPNTIKQLLFDYHSSLGQHNPDDPRFDKAFCQRIETELSSVSLTKIGPAFCEQDMSTDEIKAALNKLENNKAARMDCVQNEALKYGGDSLPESLQTLFNFILKYRGKPHDLAKRHDPFNF
jgi:hypothetical protein